MPKYMGKENGRTRIKQLKWSYPFYGRILQDKDLKFRKINPTKCHHKKSKNNKKGVMNSVFVNVLSITCVFLVFHRFLK